MLQKYLIDVAIPHQSQIGFEEPICDSFPPGEAFGASHNCKINYNLNFRNLRFYDGSHHGIFGILSKNFYLSDANFTKMQKQIAIYIFRVYNEPVT